MAKKADPPFRGAIGAEHRGSSYNAEARREETPDVLPTSPPCPFCSGVETEIMNAFGAHASVSTYWCRACGSPFELMKWRSG
jgi:transcription elongation factor Elf1